MPSVEPQVTVISVSGSISSPRYQRVFSAIAARKSRAPQVIAYWFTSASIACMAARLISAGAAKSGKPCDRLTAPCFKASRVISRMTDSVNWLALRETRREIEGAGVVIDLATDGHGLTQIRKRPIISLALIRVHVCESVAYTVRYRSRF